MKVAILCGGRGTRIREVSDLMPKPMVPVGDKPILWHIMKGYAEHGFEEFVLLLGYKGEVIREFFLNFAAHTADVTIDLSSAGPGRLFFHQSSSLPWKVTLVDTGLEAMTGARLYRGKRYFEEDDVFMATYGDGVGDVDLAKLLAFHRSHGKAATLTGVRPPGRFGEIGDKDGHVHMFTEKPQVSRGRINGGFFVFSRTVFDRFFNDREDLVLEREPLESMAEAGELMMYPHDGFWQPMDTPREFEYLNRLWQEQKAPWKTWE